MYSTGAQRGQIGFGGFGGGGPVARDLWILLGVVLFTFSMRFLGMAPLAELLSLTPAVYRAGFLWQLLTYPFVGVGVPGIWFLLELLILFWFGRDVFNALGQRNFWRLVMTSAFAAALVASLVQLAIDLTVGAPLLGGAFVLMQGQRMLLTILIVAFAVLRAEATILLFFVLPIQARWFIWITLLFAFMGFLGSRDVAGFLGLVTAVGITVAQLRGGVMPTLRRWWLRAREQRYRAELKRMRDRRGIRAVPDDRGSSGGDRWLN